MTIPHFNVLIATPGHSMEAEYVKSLIDTTKYLNENNISYLYLNQYSSAVNIAREATIMGSKFLDIFNQKPLRGSVTYDKIFWIDSDISWEIKDFMKLYNSNKDIISGIYMDQYGTPMFSVDRDPGNKLLINDFILENKIIEVSSVGFGFICIKNGVFEKIDRPWFDTYFTKILNEEGKEVLIPLQEDFSWCRKAQDFGYNIFLDPEVQINHHKKIMVNVMDFIKTKEMS